MTSMVLFIIVFVLFVVVGTISAIYTRHEIKKDKQRSLVGGKLKNSENPIDDSEKYLELVNY